MGVNGVGYVLESKHYVETKFWVIHYSLISFALKIPILPVASEFRDARF